MVICDGWNKHVSLKVLQPINKPLQWTHNVLSKAVVNKILNLFAKFFDPFVPTCPDIMYMYVHVIIKTLINPYI